MRRLAFLLPLSAAAMIAAGCAEGKATGKGSVAGSGGAAEASTTAKGARVKVVNSKYGRVIADGNGEALYLFDKEDHGRSKCYGACARVWPPVLSKGQPQPGAGAKQDLLGTTRRRNGQLQVTYAGQPLYYYVSDSPGIILCHGVEEFGGLWLVVKPNGKAAG